MSRREFTPRRSRRIAEKHSSASEAEYSDDITDSDDTGEQRFAKRTRRASMSALTPVQEEDENRLTTAKTRKIGQTARTTAKKATNSTRRSRRRVDSLDSGDTDATIEIQNEYGEAKVDLADSEDQNKHTANNNGIEVIDLVQIESSDDAVESKNQKTNQPQEAQIEKLTHSTRKVRSSRTKTQEESDIHQYDAEDEFVNSSIHADSHILASTDISEPLNVNKEQDLGERIESVKKTLDFNEDIVFFYSDNEHKTEDQISGEISSMIDTTSRIQSKESNSQLENDEESSVNSLQRRPRTRSTLSNASDSETSDSAVEDISMITKARRRGTPHPVTKTQRKTKRTTKVQLENTETSVTILESVIEEKDEDVEVDIQQNEVEVHSNESNKEKNVAHLEPREYLSSQLSANEGKVECEKSFVGKNKENNLNRENFEEAPNSDEPESDDDFERALHVISSVVESNCLKSRNAFQKAEKSNTSVQASASTNDLKQIINSIGGYGDSPSQELNSGLEKSQIEEPYLLLDSQQGRDLWPARIRPEVLEKSIELHNYSKEDPQKTKDKNLRWGDIPVVEVTPDLQKELKILSMRNYLDPTRFYKTSKSTKIKTPQKFQIGTVIAGATDFKSRRYTKLTKPHSIAEMFLNDPAIKNFTKRKAEEIVESKQKRQKVHKRKR